MENNNQLSMKWWGSLSMDQQIEVEKSHGMYGHDTGTDSFDVLDMWQREGKPRPVTKTMENNEDKRQLTPITEAIERFEKGRILFQESLDRMRNAKASRTKDYHVMEGRLQNIITSIEFLKSLLPKEEEGLINARKSGLPMPAMWQISKEQNASKWFNETFKPYEK